MVIYLYFSTVNDAPRDVYPRSIGILGVHERHKSEALRTPFVEDDLSVYYVTISLHV